MPGRRTRHPRFLAAGPPFVAGLALLLAGAVLQPAAATSIAPLEVSLGAHRFGNLRQPDAIVARTGPDGVGWESPPPGADGVSLGPWSFDVAKDGSIWLMDAINQRLLMWRPGQPDRPARTIALPEDPLDRVADFAVAADGAIYASYVPPPGTVDKNMRLAALDPSGKVRWTSATANEIFNARLRFGPDGALYATDPGDPRWTPLATPAGRPIPVAEQRRRASSRQPLPGGRSLVAKRASPQQLDITLNDPAGQPFRGWRVTSRTELGAVAATPAVVGGDPVVTFAISRQTPSEFLYEFETLRLSPKGGTSQRFSLTPDSRAVWGDTPITGLRVGPDGQLYQLRTDRKTGVSIARYSLGSTGTTPPSTITPGSDDPRVTTPPATQPPSSEPTEPTVVAAPTIPAAPAAGQRANRWLLPGLAALAAAALLAVVAWRLYRRTRTRSGG